MKLTKLQRYSVYCAMLVEMETENDTFYLCQAMDDVTDLNYKWDDTEIKKYLPELYSKKPERTHNGQAWFPGSHKKDRIVLLEQAIKETHPDL